MSAEKYNVVFVLIFLLQTLVLEHKLLAELK